MNRLALVALGARTAVGYSAETSAASVRAGIAGLREFPFLGLGGEPIVAAAVPETDPLQQGTARMLTLAAGVLAEIGEKLGTALVPPLARVRILLSLPEERPGFSEAEAVELARDMRGPIESLFPFRPPKWTLDVVGRGHAGSLLAAEQALRESRTSPRDLFLLLGVDSYLHAQALLGIEKERRLAQRDVRSGFVPGEGAGCLALASEELARQLALPTLAWLTATATGHEARLRESETGSFGVGMGQAVRAALAQVSQPQVVDTLYVDINGERYRSEEWGFVALRTPGAWRSHVYEAPANLWGDIGAAFATLASVLATRAFARGYARGPRALVMAGSDRGLRGALILENPKKNS